MVVFMSVNIALSGLALDRYSKRHDGLPASNQVSVLIDVYKRQAIHLERVMDTELNEDISGTF